jgi:pimeloyl-ACP methyl ester carboxylesterase
MQYQKEFTFPAGAPPEYAYLRRRELPRHRSSIAYFEFGDPDGRPLLCLHGLSLSGMCFAQYHQRFLELGIRAIAPCLLGGMYVADPGESFDSLTSKVLELLDLLQIGKFDMIGFSWGTVVQVSLLARAPGRIRKAGLIGTMLPTKFTDAGLLAQLKSDVRMTLNMTAKMPRFHRGLMWLVCRLPVSVLVDQFRDVTLSDAELKALEPGSAFYRHFAHYLSECVSTGSRLFTDGWRMFQDEPAYALNDLAAHAPESDVRFYIAERDNVHLPQFSAIAAAARSGKPVDSIARQIARSWPDGSSHAPGEFREINVDAHTRLCLLGGAGRMACMVYFEEALRNLMSIDA